MADERPDGDWLETYTGARFHFLDPHNDEIRIEDVAHALSMCCRYGGHTKSFYSVAEHSLLIAEYVGWLGYGPSTVLTALLHDASETYTGDMARPLKMILSDFRAVEDRIERALARKFGTIYPPPVIIKECDRRIIRDERAQCMSESGNAWGSFDDLQPLGVTIEFLQPSDAERLFLGTYQSLTTRGCP